MRNILIGLTTLTLASVGCSNQSVPSPSDGRLVTIPRGFYTSVAWVDPDTIFVTTVPDVDSPGSELWFVEMRNDPQLAQLPVEDPGCGRVDVRRITRLPDGRIGFLEFCLKNPAGGIPNADRIFIAAVNPGTGRLERLMQQPLGFNSHQFTWNPDLTRGFASTLSDLCGSIAGLTREGPFHPAIPVTENGFTWELDDYFVDQARHCERYGRADWPAWSADGASIAFLASAPRAGATSFDQIAAPWSLFVMSAEDPRPERVLGGILQPQSLAWSDDGQLAFSAGLVDRGDGIWTFDPESGQLKQVSTKPVTSLAWSPGGERIAGVFEPDPGRWPPEGVLVIFDLP